MEEHKSGIYDVTPQSDGMKVVHGEETIRRDYSDYLKDESNIEGENVQSLFFPRTINNIAWIMNEACGDRKKVTVSGGRTGICAGAVPGAGGYLLSLEKMARILGVEISSGEYSLKAECGIRLSELSSRVKSKDFGIESVVPPEISRSRTSYFYPPDPTETTATLGGTVATNASGARTLFYGPTRNYVVGIEVILSTGELLKLKRGEVPAENGFFRVQKEHGRPLIVPAPSYEMPKTKHSAGLYSKKSMDLIDLFIGSEGILGIIVNVTIRLIEEPHRFFGGVVFFQEEYDAVDFVYRVRKGMARPLAVEYFDKDALALLEGTRKSQGPVSEIPEIPVCSAAVYFESAVFRDEKPEGDNLKAEFLKWKKLIEEAGGDPQSAWAVLNKRDMMRLKALRHAVPESVNKIIAQKKLKDGRIHKVGTDIAVPDEHLKEIMKFYRELLEAERIASVIFGHIGNNHLHVNMIPDNYDELVRAKELYRRFAGKAVSLGGTVSAEHGIGKLKKDYLAILYPQNAVDEMKAIKDTLDPLNILNPGNVI